MEQLFAVAGSALIGWFIGPTLFLLVAYMLRPVVKPIFLYFENRKIANRKLSIDEQHDEELQELLIQKG